MTMPLPSPCVLRHQKQRPRRWLAICPQLPSTGPIALTACWCTSAAAAPGAGRRSGHRLRVLEVFLHQLAALKVRGDDVFLQRLVLLYRNFLRVGGGACIVVHAVGAWGVSKNSSMQAPRAPSAGVG